MDFKPQLALDQSKVKEHKLKWPMWISMKIDGVWCCAIKENDTVTIYSRTGEVFTSMRHIEEELSKLMNNREGIIFEAHVYSNTIPQPTVSGWVRDTKQQHTKLMAGCHTLLNLDDFSIPFRDSWSELRRRIELNQHDRTVATFVMQQEIWSMENARYFADCIIQHGGEGAVLRNPDAPYQPGKRNADIIKVKKGVSYDLLVVGVYPGNGKYEGTLGGLVCRYMGDTDIRISGMSDAQRKDWWDNPEKIIGKVVQVDAMCASSKGKLREPRFKGIRYDKTEGDF